MAGCRTVRAVVAVVADAGPPACTAVVVVDNPAHQIESAEAAADWHAKVARTVVAAVAVAVAAAAAVPPSAGRQMRV
jgi:hypothetical protein